MKRWPGFSALITVTAFGFLSGWAWTSKEFLLTTPCKLKNIHPLSYSLKRGLVQVLLTSRDLMPPEENTSISSTAT